MIRILSLPSYHPYTTKLQEIGEVVIINPNHDSFQSEDLQSVERFKQAFPLESYDLVHFHFEYYLITAEKLRSILAFLKKNKKKIVWTWHDREPLLTKIQNYDYEYERLLLLYADATITFTEGMKNWIRSTFNELTKIIDVIPIGFISDPDLVKEVTKKIEKKQNLYTLLVGDFRENKAYLPATIDFLHTPEMKNSILQVLYRENDPLTPQSSQKDIFLPLINKHPNIQIRSTTVFTDKELIEAFYLSHAIILPYKWGTHSGQIELARDCGCHVIVSDVGFYSEQWKHIHQYHAEDNDEHGTSKKYKRQLAKVSTLSSLRPLGEKRIQEHIDIINSHKLIYRSLLDRH